MTKSGNRCLQDIDIFKRFNGHIQVGATLTFLDKSKSEKVEPFAALPENRISTLKHLYSSGVRTWVSFEPVIDATETMELMKAVVDFVDVFKVGKINYNKIIENNIDWTDFLYKTVEMLRANKKKFYIKKDLAKFDVENILTEDETNMDFLNVSGW